MRRAALGLALVALAAGVALAAPKPYSSAKMKFSALFPYDVTEKADDEGNGTAGAFSADKTVMYMVGALKSPEVPKGAEATRATLDAGLDGMAKNVKGSIKSTKDVTLGKHPGREAVIEFPGGEANFRVFLVVDRVYMVGVVHKAGATPPVSPAEFFASFRLAGK